MFKIFRTFGAILGGGVLVLLALVTQPSNL